ncbi:hypothetical protein GOBAR_AA13538 [Gossypium barbadense]|uniref:Uncharacterized protein n=1 Tax=Gossypium barbadense TaxID=3634 RepID=A0A2P5XUT5_GOSBA|nr:hypothetical protein GOBAR_AA13538 [Gossypium barbadense]
MVQPTLQKLSLKEAHESFLSNSRGPVHEDQRLQIEELDDDEQTNQEHPTNQNYAKISPIPLQINLRCFHRDTAKHTGVLKAV